MNGFFWNCLLAVVWVLVTGDLSVFGMITGFIFGAIILVIVGPAIGSPGYLAKARKLAILVAFFVKDLVTANLLVSFDVLTPRSRLHPGIIAVPLDAKTDNEITAFASLLTLTPGTTTLDVSEDRSTLYVHVMYLDRQDIESTKRAIKEGLERHLLEVTR